MEAIICLIIIGLLIGVVFDVWWPFIVVLLFFSIVFAVIFAKKLQKMDEGGEADGSTVKDHSVTEGDSDFFTSEEPQKHPNRCTGDCINCPDHYGYRHGRWYYGHHHTHGCEFGGHGGNGELD